MPKIFTCADVLAGLEKEWLQHLRDFDTAHPGCHFEVWADVPNTTQDEIMEVLRVNPELGFTQYFERVKQRMVRNLEIKTKE